MKTEADIREAIARTTNAYKHVLDCGCASVQVNSPRALMQVAGCAHLDTLYWFLDEVRPEFRCDDPTQIDH